MQVTFVNEALGPLVCLSLFTATLVDKEFFKLVPNEKKRLFIVYYSLFSKFMQDVDLITNGLNWLLVRD
jgi:hypothetical protein